MADQHVRHATFRWEGTDRKGVRVKGELHGVGPAQVRAQLRQQGITPDRVRRKGRPLFGGGQKIRPLDVALFTRQLATMLKAGVPLLQSFEIIADGTEKPAMRELIHAVRQSVAAGESLAGSLRRRPQHFDALYCSLVAAGEQSGALETLLERIATCQEKNEALKTRVRKAMTYPGAVFLVAAIVSAILLIKVVPQFQSVFASFGGELPVFTLMVIGLSEALQAWWSIILLVLLAAGWGWRQAWRRSVAFREGNERLLLRLPLLGSIVCKSALARYARTLSTSFAAGVPLIEALDSVAGATGNVVFRQAVQRIRQDVSSGMQLHFSMRAANVFPALAVQMTAIGEESGALDSMLDKVAEYYEAQVDNMVDNLTTLMEPMIMAVLGVLVGGLIIAMYLPIFQLGAVM